MTTDKVRDYYRRDLAERGTKYFPVAIDPDDSTYCDPNALDENFTSDLDCNQQPVFEAYDPEEDVYFPLCEFHAEKLHKLGWM